MIRFLAIVSVTSALALPVMADEEGVPLDVPPGVLIFDVVPEDAAIPAVVETEPPLPVLGAGPAEPAPVLAPPAAGSASASLRSASEPIIIIDVTDEAAPEAAVALPVIIDVTPAPELAATAIAPTRSDPPRNRPEPKVDPVTGRLRDTPGWTGRTDAPASIGCFPEGACAVLNLR